MSISKQLEAIRAAEEAKAELAKAATVIRFARSQDFDTIKEFISFLKGFEGSEDEILKFAPRDTGPVAAKRTSTGRGEVPAGFEEAVKAGRTGKELSKEFGVSVPTIQNWKKKLGLVRK